MSVQFLAPMVEIGIVTNNTEAMLRYYREVLGLPYREHLEYPGGSQHRFACGDSVIKLVSWEQPSAEVRAGDPKLATGLRYFSLAVANLRQVVDEVKAAGYAVPTDITEFGPSFGFAFLEDPDGNWIEMYGPI